MKTTMTAFILAGMLSLSGGCLWAAEVEQIVRQDEIFFLQEELKKAQAVCAESQTATVALRLEKEALQSQLSSLREERDLLQRKVDQLQKTILDRSDARPQELAAVLDPFQKKIDEMTRDLRVLQFTVDQKNEKINDLNNALIVARAELDRSAAEKANLREDLRRMEGQIKGMRAEYDKRLVQEQAGLQEKIKDLQARFSAEQTLTQEKIKQAEKPSEDKVAALTEQVKAKEADKTRALELQSRLLREEADRRVREAVKTLEQTVAALTKERDEALTKLQKAADKK